MNVISRARAGQDAPPVSASCRATRGNLRAYVRARLGQRETARLSAHLECCRACTTAYLEIVGVGPGRAGR